jgi:HEAT repeat protein
VTDDRSIPHERPLDVLNARGLTAKREYVRGLEQRHDDEALSLLIECLCDESWYLRDLAEQAFLRLGEEGARVLLPLLDEGLWFTRSSGARVIGRMGYRPAVPRLLRMARDSNAMVAQSAREALAEIARRGGASRVAHEIHGLDADLRRRHLADLQGIDRELAQRVETLMRKEELMSVEDPDGLSDDSPAVRASEEGVSWEILTGPPAPRDRTREPGAGGAS